MRSVREKGEFWDKVKEGNGSRGKGRKHSLWIQKRGPDHNDF